jgi:histidyl-tRNA synthetase
MTFAPLRGFRDYPPPDAGARSQIRHRMRGAARRCGFVELETPSVESLDLFRVKSGDAIGEELWAFRDKGDREVALVAETTPSLARIFVDRAKSEPMPVKWFTISRLWRYEEPQSGRTREFLQFNLDILGVPGMEAEAEILGTAALVLDSIGAEGLYAFRINDRGLVEALGGRFGVPEGGMPAFLRALDRSAKSTAEEFRQGLAQAGVGTAAIEELRGLLVRTAGGVPIDQLEGTLTELEAGGLSEAGRAGTARLGRLASLLGALHLTDRVVFDPTVVRGLAYYTTTVFEAFDRTGDARALFGGGRYDRLVELFGGPPTPACGLAIGDQTLELLLKAHDRWPEGEPPLDTYVVAVTPELVPSALELVQRLRAAGTSADADLLGRSLSKQLKEAARRRARRALILGPREVARGVMVERDLSTGVQRERTPQEALGPG